MSPPTITPITQFITATFSALASDVELTPPVSPLPLPPPAPPCATTRVDVADASDALVESIDVVDAVVDADAAVIEEDPVVVARPVLLKAPL